MDYVVYNTVDNKEVPANSLESANIQASGIANEVNGEVEIYKVTADGSLDYVRAVNPIN